eukprot:2691205-Pleurochrysis_carterae.AAC.4
MPDLVASGIYVIKARHTSHSPRRTTRIDSIFMQHIAEAGPSTKQRSQWSVHIGTATAHRLPMGYTVKHHVPNKCSA